MPSGVYSCSCMSQGEDRRPRIPAVAVHKKSRRLLTMDLSKSGRWDAGVYSEAIIAKTARRLPGARRQKQQRQRQTFAAPRHYCRRCLQRQRCARSRFRHPLADPNHLVLPPPRPPLLRPPLRLPPKMRKGFRHCCHEGPPYCCRCCPPLFLAPLVGGPPRRTTRKSLPCLYKGPSTQAPVRMRGMGGGG